MCGQCSIEFRFQSLRFFLLLPFLVGHLKKRKRKKNALSLDNGTRIKILCGRCRCRHCHRWRFFCTPNWILTETKKMIIACRFVSFLFASWFGSNWIFKYSILIHFILFYSFINTTKRIRNHFSLSPLKFETAILNSNENLFVLFAHFYSSNVFNVIIFFFYFNFKPFTGSASGNQVVKGRNCISNFAEIKNSWTFSKKHLEWIWIMDIHTKKKYNEVKYSVE